MVESWNRRKLNRHSIAWRLVLAFGAVLVVIGLVSISCIWALFEIHERLHAAKADEVRARSVVRLASAVRDQYAHVAHTIIIENDSHARFFRDATTRLHALVSDVRQQVGPKGAAEVDWIERTSADIDRLFESEVLPAVKRGDRAALAARHERILALAMKAQEQAELLAGQVEREMEHLNRHVRATQHGAILLTVVAQVVALLVALLVGFYLYSTIARPIAALSAGASRVSAGDLSAQIRVEGDDELGRLSRRFNDMTAALKEHQGKLLKSERLVGLATMSGAIAHELNNPVGVILGYAKLLRRRGSGADPTVLAAIEEEAERCHQVIEGLLELTRGRILNSSPVDLRALADDVVQRLRVSGAAPAIAIAIHGRATVEGDQGKLRQVLANVTANAIEACGSEGRITILIDERQPGVTSVEVHDSGQGISAEARDQLFEPFFTTKATGSGLGLAISRAIARAHGGDVAVVSTTPRGTIVRLTLPINRGSAA